MPHTRWSFFFWLVFFVWVFLEESTASLTFVLNWSYTAACMHLHACNICMQIICVYMKNGSSEVHIASLAAVYQRNLYALNL